jgi:hypothetical protein
MQPAHYVEQQRHGDQRDDQRDAKMTCGTRQTAHAAFRDGAMTRSLACDSSMTCR